MNETVLEIVGYVSSAIVLVSFLMSSAVKLRLINAVGAAIFTVYAFLTHSYPTAVMNLCIVIIDVYYLVKLTRNSTLFSIFPVTNKGQYLSAFLKFYEADIQRYFPGFQVENYDADTAYFVHCNMVTAGVLLGKHREDGTLEIVADYSTPTYRDCSVGKYLYRRLPAFGIKRLVCAHNQVASNHDKYMGKMGFRCEDGVFIKEL